MDPGSLAIAATLGSAALSTASGVAQGQGQAAGYRLKEAQSQRVAFAARTAADQTDSKLRDELAVTIGNIEAIRAAAGVGADSPTGMAIEERQRKISDRQRRIQVGNLNSQADQAASDAAYFNAAAGDALGMGWLSGLAGGFRSLSSMGRRSYNG